MKLLDIFDKGAYTWTSHRDWRSAKRYGNRQAVVCGGTRYTWIDFDQRTDALACGWRLSAYGVVIGQRN